MVNVSFIDINFMSWKYEDVYHIKEGYEGITP